MSTPKVINLRMSFGFSYTIAKLWREQRRMSKKQCPHEKKIEDTARKLYKETESARQKKSKRLIVHDKKVLN